MEDCVILESALKATLDTSKQRLKALEQKQHKDRNNLRALKPDSNSIRAEICRIELKVNRRAIRRAQHYVVSDQRLLRIATCHAR
ncbi:MAG: hypothetical protein UT63_C0064G0031 [Candidatus Gottesmanbacteria bacterium GW2011_GWC2_39_8]|uniref:Uncharacterized protein n=1 Tax=Candidatus Gottesmanbacteria bacterium GW2011_GWC2_39_8 TaxID=1618450 RepID=A0A0G0PU28_9BACT|nr:MAG: hypothetical protein UT63_C0064G0031 [Candidatus Gottesmanbacteria bacterium GW2011_GWC2_39_8]